MALIDPTIKTTVTESQDSEKLWIYDNTGTYNATTNTTGYGGGVNIASADVTQEIMKIYLPDATVPYIWTFTVASNVITAAKITDIDGTDTNIVVADLPDDAWPFASTAPMEVLATDVGFAETFTDGWYIIERIVSGSYTPGPTAFSITTSKDVLLKSTAQCCVKKMFIEAAGADCGCGCSKLDEAKTAQAFLTSAIYAANLGLMSDAVINLNKSKELCGNNCNGCN